VISRAVQTLSAPALRNPLWCLVEQGNHKKMKMQKLNLGVVLCLPASCTANPDSCLFTPKISSSVAIESATVKIRYLHLFQIVRYSSLFMQIV
jgi:hypothetical protein